MTSLRKFRFRPSLCWWWLFVSCVLLVGFHAATLWQLRQQTLIDAERHTTNLAASVRVHADQVFQRADDAAAEIVRLVEVMPAGAVESLMLQELLLHRTSEADGVLRELTVYGRDGRVRFSSIGNALGHTEANLRDFFLHHQTTARDEAYLGSPYRTELDGQWIVPLSRRIATKDGSFDGVVVASVDVDRLQHALAEFDVGRSGSLTLLTRAGVVVARFPATPEHIGFNARLGPMLPILESSGHRMTSTLVSVIDGVERQITMERGRNYPVVVVAAAGKAEALAGWNDVASVGGVVLVCLLSLLVWLAGAMLRSLRREQDVADALSVSHRRLQDIERAVREHAVIAVTDSRGRIVDVNHKFCELSGYTSEELLTRHLPS